VSWLRLFLVLSIIGAAIGVTLHYGEHHDGGIFQTLYMHLMPQKLVRHGPAEHGTEEHATAEHGVGDHAEAPALLAIPLGIAPHGELVLTNLQVFQVAAVLLIFVCFMGVPAHLRTGKGDVGARMFAGFASWIRDEMVVPVMGKQVGSRLLPLFLSIFFFILFMNVLGLVPGAATPTASIFVTGALALITFVAMIVGGMVVQGPIAFWKHLVPHVPAALWPLMFAVEIVGLFVKPIALMIRLFANMTGGHLAVLSLMGLIFFFGSMSPVVGWASSPVAVGLAVFIMIIESFVALLQAYIFTTLSIIFVQASIHPEH
jgi:F-type H+-transporting ATPase subunit a